MRTGHVCCRSAHFGMFPVWGTSQQALLQKIHVECTFKREDEMDIRSKFRIQGQGLCVWHSLAWEKGGEEGGLLWGVYFKF